MTELAINLDISIISLMEEEIIQKRENKYWKPVDTQDDIKEYIEEHGRFEQDNY